MAGAPGESGMLGENRGVHDPVGVHVEDDGAVQDDLDPRPPGDHLLLIPLAHGILVPGPGGEDVVERAVPLPGLEVLVPLRPVVDDLQLDPIVGDVSGDERRADPQAVVGPLEETEVETEDEVLVLPLGQQVAAIF